MLPANPIFGKFKLGEKIWYTELSTPFGKVPGVIQSDRIQSVGEKRNEFIESSVSPYVPFKDIDPSLLSRRRKEFPEEKARLKLVKFGLEDEYIKWRGPNRNKSNVSKLDFSFKPKDFDRAKRRYASELSFIVSAPEYKYHRVMGIRLTPSYAENTLILSVRRGPWFKYMFEKTIKKEGLDQDSLDDLKSYVREKTENFIAKQLSRYELPSSHSFPFYIHNYNKVNKLMREVTKEVLRRIGVNVD